MADGIVGVYFTMLYSMRDEKQKQNTRTQSSQTSAPQDDVSAIGGNTNEHYHSATQITACELTSYNLGDLISQPLCCALMIIVPA